jgi:hypothetical protein
MAPRRAGEVARVRRKDIPIQNVLLALQKPFGGGYH